MQMKGGADRQGCVVAGFRRASALLLGAEEAAVFNFWSKVGKTATVGFENGRWSEKRKGWLHRLKNTFNRTTTGAVAN